MNRGIGFVVSAGIIIFALVLIGLNKAFPGTLSQDDNLMHFLYLMALLSVLSLGFFSGVQGSAGQILKQIAAWIGIAAVVIAGYSYREEFLGVATRMKSELMPMEAASIDDRTVQLRATHNGHFNVSALVDGRKINFLVDTGASSVALTPQDAKRLGYNSKKLKFTQPVNTANGITYVAPIQLRVIKIGDIVVSNVRATVHKDGLDQSLLGMSFLGRLNSITVNKNTLVLQQ